jgi:hypothetical protein
VVIGVVVASVGGQPLGAQGGAADRSPHIRHGVEEGISCVTSLWLRPREQQGMRHSPDATSKGANAFRRAGVGLPRFRRRSWSFLVLGRPPRTGSTSRASGTFQSPRVRVLEPGDDRIGVEPRRGATRLIGEPGDEAVVGDE